VTRRIDHPRDAQSLLEGLARGVAPIRDLRVEAMVAFARAVLPAADEVRRLRREERRAAARG
jgi:hypothetical protein